MKHAIDTGPARKKRRAISLRPIAQNFKQAQLYYSQFIAACNCRFQMLELQLAVSGSLSHHH